MPERLPEGIQLLAYPKDAALDQKAYHMCLQAEAHYALGDPGDLVCVRHIGWMLQRAPSAECRNAIARKILDKGPEDDVKNVQSLGAIYLNYYI
jgi:hypothetical protein